MILSDDAMDSLDLNAFGAQRKEYGDPFASTTSRVAGSDATDDAYLGQAFTAIHSNEAYDDWDSSHLPLPLEGPTTTSSLATIKPLTIAGKKSRSGSPSFLELDKDVAKYEADNGNDVDTDEWGADDEILGMLEDNSSTKPASVAITQPTLSIAADVKESDSDEVSQVTVLLSKMQVSCCNECFLFLYECG